MGQKGNCQYCIASFEKRKKAEVSSLDDDSLMVVDYRANAQEQLQAADVLKTIQKLATWISNGI